MATQTRPKPIGARLRAHREDAGLTLGDVETDVKRLLRLNGLSRETIRRLEVGQYAESPKNPLYVWAYVKACNDALAAHGKPTKVLAEFSETIAASVEGLASDLVERPSGCMPVTAAHAA